VARIGEGVDPLERLIDRAGQGEGVQAIARAAQLRGHAGIDLRTGEHALKGRARGVVPAADPGADSLLAEELDRGQEEVLEQAQ
jgi:hypothetical protein